MIYEDVEYEISEDCICEVYHNEPEKFFNQDSAIIIRNISFLHIRSSIDAFKHLAAQFEHTCQEIEDEGSANYDYEIIAGIFIISSANNTSALKGKKLIEIIHPINYWSFCKCSMKRLSKLPRESCLGRT